MICASSLSAACGALDDLAPHDANGCRGDSDCHPGHVCLGGTCTPPPVDAGDAKAGELGGDGAGRDPCVPGPDDGTNVKAADATGALLGTWRLCDATGADPRVLSLVGMMGTIVLDDLTWRGVAPDGGAAPNGSPSGLYFQILEGPRG